MDRFEWDEDKAELNLVKHGIDFFEAASVWFDDFSLEMLDLNHSLNEERWLRLGFSEKANLLVVVYVERSDQDRIRIISARKATRPEREEYNRGKL
jgi:uncharacterized DUF497 family protein